MHVVLEYILNPNPISFQILNMHDFKEKNSIDAPGRKTFDWSIIMSSVYVPVIGDIFPYNLSINTCT